MGGRAGEGRRIAAAGKSPPEAYGRYRKWGEGPLCVAMLSYGAGAGGLRPPTRRHHSQVPTPPRPGRRRP